MGKSIEYQAGYVKNSNMVDQRALIELIRKYGVKTCLMQDTVYSDGSQEIKILISVPKELNKP